MVDVDEGGRSPTTTPPLTIHVHGIARAEVVDALRRVVADHVVALGSFFDLRDLDGLTIAVDYDAALADLDYGFEGSMRLGRTDTETMQGVARTCQVVRAGSVKSHIVLGASMMISLVAGDLTTPEAREIALGLIAHECCHVQLNSRMSELVPDARIDAEIADWGRALTFQVARVLWEEYAVSRLSARFAPRQNDLNAELVLGVAPGARERADESIRAYRSHGDLNVLLGEAGSELCQPLKAASYLLGGMDGAGQGWREYPAAAAAVSAGGFAALVDALHERCEALWVSQADWSAEKDVLAPLRGLVCEALSSGGIHLRRMEAGDWYVDVPFTPQTLPSA